MNDRWIDRILLGAILAGQVAMFTNLSGQLTDVRERLARVETHLEYIVPRPAEPKEN